MAAIDAETEATGSGVVEVAAASDGLTVAVVGHLQAATADSEEPAPPAAEAAIMELVTSKSALGLGGSGQATSAEEMQVSAILTQSSPERHDPHPILTASSHDPHPVLTILLT